MIDYKTNSTVYNELSRQKEWLKMTTQEATNIIKEIKETDQKAFEQLKAKCQWEQMTQLSVVKEWGDPRKW